VERFSGVVLTGGASTRMGRDKAFVTVRGRPMARIAAHALAAAGAAEVFCVGGDLAALRAAGLDGRPDRHPGEGPLGGLVTGLAEASTPLAVVLSCDLPLITGAEVDKVVAALADRPDVAAAAPVVDGRPQFLTAGYRVAPALAGLAAAFASGERAVRRGAAALAWVGVHGLDLDHLLDADRPEDLPDTGGASHA
jgi:molybdopterin-guanine dinucleotide biosynthesis protein A